ncbi:MAG: PLP-dependent aminotransferase family protein [Filimonas sp.]|nr:PLP-dependent aminotransferase family protein [Filimonas sp.]
MPKESPEIFLSGIKLSRKSSEPLYAQLYAQLREMIIHGRLRAGDRLPAGRTLAEELGISRVIVSQTYEQLTIEGYLIGKTGSGTFVADTLPDHLLHAGKLKVVSPKPKKEPVVNINESTVRLPASSTENEIVPFHLGVPSLDSFPFKIWHQIGNKVLKDLKKQNLGYNNTLGYWPLRKAIASYLRLSRAVQCEAEQVIIVTGAQQGMNLVAQCLLKRGDKVCIEDPGYFGAASAFANAGVEMCPVPVREDGFDVDYAQATYKNIKLAYVTPSHQFPLGYTLSQEKRKQLLAWAEANDTWILEDDYDSEYRYEGRPLPSLQGLDTCGRVIYCGTFSKVLFPALRLGYLVLPSAEMVQGFKKIKQIIDTQPPLMEQLILCSFMEEGYFLRHIRKMRLLYAERLNTLLTLVKDQLSEFLTPNTSQSGMHLLCWLSDDIDAAKLKAEVRKEKVFVSFPSEYTIQHHMPPSITLGFPAFTKYRLKLGVEKLKVCMERARK